MDFSQALDDLKEGRAIARAAWAKNDEFATAHVTMRLSNIRLAIKPHEYGVPFVVMMTALSLPPFSTQGTERKVNDRTAQWIGEDVPLESGPYMSHYDPKTNAWQPGWLPSAEDIFAEDWISL